MPDGRSDFEPVWAALEQRRAAAPPGIIVCPDVLSDEQVEGIRSQIGGVSVAEAATNLRRGMAVLGGFDHELGRYWDTVAAEAGAEPRVAPNAFLMRGPAIVQRSRRSTVGSPERDTPSWLQMDTIGGGYEPGPIARAVGFLWDSLVVGITYPVGLLRATRPFRWVRLAVVGRTDTEMLAGGADSLAYAAGDREALARLHAVRPSPALAEHLELLNRLVP